LYNLYAAHKKDNPQKNRRKIIYCPAPFTFYDYKDLLENVCDKELFGINKDTIDIVDKFHLKIDIKVHPCEEVYNYLYFKNLSRARYKNNICVLKLT